MDTLIGILVLVIGLLVSIALHEVGHMVPAKKFGVRVSEYFVGFGPRVWSRRGRETEYGVKAIPLGGYVRLVGMIPPEDRVKPVRGTGWASRLIADAREAAVEEIQPGEDARAFYHLAWWKKAIVMLGGPLVNLVLAVLIFTAVLTTVGSPTQSLTVGEVVPCVPAAAATECAAGDPTSPASEAGLEAGDTIVAVGGTVVDDWEQATGIIADSPGETLTLDVTRDGEPLALTVTPGERDRALLSDDGEVVLDASGAPLTETVGYLGVYSEVVTEPQSITAGAALTWDYLGRTVEVVATLPVHLYDVSRAALGLEERSQDSIMGVVGVGRVAGEISGAEVDGYGLSQKVADMLMLLGGLNLALFAFNMIPLVPLDGGHVASALWQGIKNGWARLRSLPTPAPVDVARMMPVAYAVFGILLVMGVVLIYADIVAPVRIV
ncbi:M50 family metallopeptidase [Demequina muriae]|uniref:Site-2 protease family protein n=1 Tax=Demequina muriae TaxID=3051664 RepID=A0ABT8GDU6_9MICO|nr:site-2 protease family protein [Demequina sp. EGI L300058]MDN4479595.1 site-2 protease family protein [Demequina sp. EGI L300058]